MAEPARSRVEAPSSLSERIVMTYLTAACGDPHRAIRALADDALADLCEAERRCGERDRLISAGYVRAAPGVKV